MILTRRILVSTFALAVIFLALPLRASTFTWNNTSGGDWNVPGNWTPNGVPGGSDTATITGSGIFVVNVSDTESAASITVGGSATRATLRISSGGALSASGASVSGNGTVTILAGGTLNATAQLNVDGPLTNSGTMNLTNSAVYVNNNQTTSYQGGIVNLGQINFYGASGDRIYSQSGHEYFLNQGTINQEAGTGTSSISGAVGVLDGTYNAASGTTLTFSGASAGAPLTPDSTLNLNGPGQYHFTAGYLLLSQDTVPNLTLTGGTLTLGPAFQKGGAITNLVLNGIVLSGTYQVNGAFVVTNSSINGPITIGNGGTFNGYSATLNAPMSVGSGGIFNLTQSSIGGAGSVTTQAGGTLDIAGQLNASGPMTNSGTMNLTNAALYVNNNQTPGYQGGIVNQGQINLYGASGDRIYSQSGHEYFLNLGTVNQETGTGTSSISAGTGVLDGTYNAAAGTTVQFSGGSVAAPLSQDLTLKLNGPGQFQFSSGNLLLSQDTVPGLTLTGGTLTLGPAFQQGGAITNLILNGIVLSGTNQVDGAFSVTNSSLNGPITIGNGGVFNGYSTTINAPMTVGSGGIFNLTQSSIGSAGSMTVQAGGTLNVTSQLNMSGTVTNSGTMNLTNAALYVNNNQTANYQGGIVNEGQINLYGASGDHIYSQSGHEYFINEGTINLETGTGNSSIAGAIEVLDGTYNAASGTTLSFSGGSASAPLTPDSTLKLNGLGQYLFSGGNLQLPDDVVPGLTLTSGTLTLGPSFQKGGAITNLVLNGITLSGTYQVGGTFGVTNSSINGPVTVNNGGVFNGSSVTINVPLTVGSGGIFNLTQSSIGSAGSMTVQAGGTLNVTSQLNMSGTVTNSGTMNLTNAAIYVNNNQTANYQGGIVNEGQINLYGASGDHIYSQSGHEYFLNQGTINLETGTGNSSIAGAIGVLDGTYDAASGTTLTFSGASAGAPLTPDSTLNLNGPGQYQFTAGFLLLSQDTVPNLTLTGGTLTLGPAFQKGGAITNLVLSGITLSGTSQVDGTLGATGSPLNGPVTVNNGGVFSGSSETINAPVSVGSGGIFNLTQSSIGSAGSVTAQAGGTLNVTSQLNMSGTVTNSGTMNLTNAAIYVNNNQTANYQGGIVNEGQINLYGASGDHIYSQSGHEYFINEGTVSQRLGTGNSSISASTFSDPGTIDSLHGTLTLSSLNLQSSSVLNFGLNSTSDFGVIAVLASNILTGTVSANFNSGYVPSTGASFKVLTGPGISGIFSNTNVPSGTTAQGVYGLTTFNLLFAKSGTSGASPVLTIERVGAGTVDVSWPTAAGNFTLQTSPDPKPGNWASVVNGITTVGANYVLTTGTGGKAAFYRLESQ